jgi:hypothetical protein
MLGEITTLEYLEYRQYKKVIDRLVKEYVELYLRMTGQKERYTGFGAITEYHDTYIEATWEDSCMGTVYSVPINIFTTILFGYQQKWEIYIQKEIDAERLKQQEKDKMSHEKNKCEAVEQAKKILRDAGYKVSNG